MLYIGISSIGCSIQCPWIFKIDVLLHVISDFKKM